MSGHTSGRCLECDETFSTFEEAQKHYHEKGCKTWSVPISWLRGRAWGIPALFEQSVKLGA